MKTLSLALASFMIAGGSVAAAQSINAAGATFPFPIYSKWFEEFRQAHKSVEINYQSIGSGGGIQQLTSGTVDFGASDMPLKDEQISAMKIKPLHFPTVMGGIVPTYNVPGVTQDLKFTPETLAGIYLGKITKWNDPKLVKDNPGAKLPDLEIALVHRAEASGTTFVFTDYLSKVSPEWKSRVGASTAVKWPAGMGQKGNEGVAGYVKETPGALGYVELIYAVQNHLPYGLLRNQAGEFLKADFNSVTAAAAGAATSMPADFRVSITNSPGKAAYPISTFTWLLIPTKIEDSAKRKAITEFLDWMLVTGQKDCAALGYAPLPKEVVGMVKKQISQIQ